MKLVWGVTYHGKGKPSASPMARGVFNPNFKGRAKAWNAFQGLRLGYFVSWTHSITRGRIQ